jgi:GNAT superfamily N-acetyltransferase
VVEIVLKPITAMTEQEHADAAALRAAVDFGVPPYQWTPHEDRPFRVLVWEDGRLVSQVALLQREIGVGGDPVQVVGVAGVMTAPSARGRGYASAAMTRAAGYMRDETAADFGLLLCLDKRVRLYERLGWQLVRDEVVCEQPGGCITVGMNAMSLSLRGGRWPMGQVDFKGLPW